MKLEELAHSIEVSQKTSALLKLAVLEQQMEGKRRAAARAEVMAQAHLNYRAACAAAWIVVQGAEILGTHEAPWWEMVVATHLRRAHAVGPVLYRGDDGVVVRDLLVPPALNSTAPPVSAGRLAMLGNITVGVEFLTKKRAVLFNLGFGLVPRAGVNHDGRYHRALRMKPQDLPGPAWALHDDGVPPDRRARGIDVLRKLVSQPAGLATV